MENYKNKDMEAIIAYMNGKESVEVTDIIKKSGANSLRVYPIIEQMYMEHKVEILETIKLGAPKTVRLK